MVFKILNKQALFFPTALLVLVWAFFGLQHLGFFADCKGAIIPLAIDGFLGVLISPLLHANLDHLLSNSIPLWVLTFLLFQFYRQIALRVFISGWFISGFLIWLLPPFAFTKTTTNSYACIIGASGVVYFLAFFLFASGLFRKNIQLLSISLLVSLFYGGMLWGMFPEEWLNPLEEPSKISWQSHLMGGLIGVVMAFQNRKKDEKKTKYMWEYPHYYNEKDDLLWRKYQENYPEDFDELPYYQKEDKWSFLEDIRNSKSSEQTL